MIVSLCLDRAASNIVCLMWLFNWVSNHLPLNCLPMAEPCFCHGVPLVKIRSRTCLSVTGGMTSFVKWIKVGKNSDDLLPHLICSARDVFNRILGPAPPDHDDTTQATIRMLYRSEKAREELWNTDAQGTRVKSPKLIQLEKVANVVRINVHGTWVIIHYCHVREGSPDHLDHGKTPGQPCCENDEVAFEKTFEPVNEWINARAWSECSEGRWTQVSSTERRIIIVWPVVSASLQSLKLGSSLSDSMEASLARVIEADAEHHSAENNLRWLRICMKMCTRQSGIFLAIQQTCNGEVDNVLYYILGRQSTGVTLADFCASKTSPVAECLANLTTLASRFAADADGWASLRFVNADFTSEEVVRLARRHLVQLECGLVSHFELKMSCPPYTLADLPSGDLDLDAKKRLATLVFQMPMECLPLWLQRLRRLYPTLIEFLAHCDPVIIAWGKTLFSIDEAERGHAGMRVDLSTACGPASDFVAASDRSVLKVVTEEHTRRKGADPAYIPIPLTLGDATSGDGDGAPTRGGAIVLAGAPQGRKRYWWQRPHDIS